MVEISPKELVKEFFEKEKKRPQIIKKELEEFVKNTLSRGKITVTQIRRHYNYFLDVYQEANASGSFSGDHQLRLAMEKVYLMYDLSRGNINDLFKDFVVSLIDSVKDLETLKLAKRLFEGFVGYSKFYEEKNKQEKRNRAKK